MIYYKEINDDELNILLNEEFSIFTDNELDKLNSLFPKYNFSYEEGRRDKIINYIYVEPTVIGKNKPVRSVYLNRLDDEWFIVQVEDNRDKSNRFDNEYFSYKCDQWDGLISCLTMLL